MPRRSEGCNLRDAAIAENVEWILQRAGRVVIGAANGHVYPTSLDELLSAAAIPRYLLDLRKVPAGGPVADRFAATSSIMTGAQATPVNPMAAFDAVVYVDRVTPWHHSLDQV